MNALASAMVDGAAWSVDTAKTEKARSEIERKRFILPMSLAQVRWFRRRVRGDARFDAFWACQN
jgi:hypothetical protein